MNATNVALCRTDDHDGHRTLAPRDVKNWATVFFQSGMFKDIKGVAQAMVKIQAGNELGLPPFASMRGFDIVEGKVAPNAGLTGALIKRFDGGRYSWQIVELSNERCVLSWHCQGEPVPGDNTSSFTMDDARLAGLAGKRNWKAYPRAMLYARALTMGARIFCPDVFLGSSYVPEELGVDEAPVMDPETGEICAPPDAPEDLEILTVEGELVPTASGNGQLEDPATSETVSDRESETGQPKETEEANEAEVRSWKDAIAATDAPSTLLSLLPQIDAIDHPPRRFGALKLWSQRICAVGSPEDLDCAAREIEAWHKGSPGRHAVLAELRSALALLAQQVA